MMQDQIIATIHKIISHENLNMVHLDYGSIRLKMLTLDLDSSMREGIKVSLNIKPLAIALGRELHEDLSFSNQIPMRIQSVEQGAVLSSVTLLCLDTVLESVISSESLIRMGLQKDQEVIAYIRASEISIDEVVS